MARSILSDAERLAWERFPPDPDPDVIGAYFTLADGEVDDLRRLPTSSGRLATAVAVAAIRWLGFMPAAIEQAPAAGVQRLADQLDVDVEHLAAYNPPERTAREHRQRAAQVARFRDPESSDIDDVENLVVEHALQHDSPLTLLRRGAGAARPSAAAPGAVDARAARRVRADTRRARHLRAPRAAARRADAASTGRAVRDRRASRCQPAGVAGPRS